jgi:DNA-binding IclR family transcriptional regulator
MSDPSTYWLTLMNIALGLLVLAACLAVAFGVVQELAARRKKSAAMSHLDREVADLVSSYGSHAFNVPGLGLTMADGGEERDKKEEER